MHAARPPGRARECLSEQQRSVFVLPDKVLDLDTQTRTIESSPSSPPATNATAHLHIQQTFIVLQPNDREVSDCQYVTYRGVTGLPQLAWEWPWAGPILVISLFDGMGSTLLALLALGVTFSAVAFEVESDAASFRNVIQGGDVRSLNMEVAKRLFEVGHFTSLTSGVSLMPKKWPT